MVVDAGAVEGDFVVEAEGVGEDVEEEVVGVTGMATVAGMVGRRTAGDERTGPHTAPVTMAMWTRGTGRTAIRMPTQS